MKNRRKIKHGNPGQENILAPLFVLLIAFVGGAVIGCVSAKNVCSPESIDISGFTEHSMGGSIVRFGIYFIPVLLSMGLKRGGFLILLTIVVRGFVLGCTAFVLQRNTQITEAISTSAFWIPTMIQLPCLFLVSCYGLQSIAGARNRQNLRRFLGAIGYCLCGLAITIIVDLFL